MKKLSDEDARKILDLRRSKKTYQAIAAEIQCSIGTVRNICKGKTHRDLVSSAL